jgi:uncharacterized Fe-S cluster-containing radical SAM superfamily protein
MVEFGFDPIQRAEYVERIIIKDNKRKYYRFRAAPYYGGISTADTVGCCFLCCYCWNYKRNLNPENFGRFYSAEEVAKIILDIAKKKNFSYLRLTGAEPILGEETFNHFLEIANFILNEDSNLVFILETNGLILGYYPDLIDRINLKNLSIRISIKGWDETSFEKISGVSREYFKYPLIALKRLRDSGLDGWCAVMEDFFDEEKISILKKRLEELNLDLEIEREILERYPFCLENIKRRDVNLVI